MRAIISFLTMTCLAGVLAASAGATAGPASPRLQASVDRNRVALGDAFELRLRATGDGSAAPDLRPLEVDFHILGVSQSAQSVIVNGQLGRHHEWVVGLAARELGAHLIPGLGLPGVAGSQSKPIEIEVVGARANPPQGRMDARATDTAREGPSLFVEAEVDDESPYVQGQVILRVRIHSEAPLLEGRLAEPQLMGASVERVGEDESYEQEVDGRRYQVIEREYAIFPQRSGVLEIPPIAFEGRVLQSAPSRSRGSGRRPTRFGRGSSLFDELQAMMNDDAFGTSAVDGFFGPGGRSVRVQTEALLVDVKPRPAEAQGRWWLPAAALEVVEHWDDESGVLRVGEELTRSLEIRALGASRDQLPDLELPDIPGFKQYREPAVAETVATRDGLAAIKQQETILIPSEPGEHVLPAIELEWWDTREDRARIARLPERRIRVVAGDGVAAAAAPPVSPGGGVSPTTDAAQAVLPTNSGGEAAQPVSPEGQAWTTPLVAGACVLALLAPVLLAFWVRSSGRSDASPANAKGASGGSPIKRAERALDQACATNDPVAVTQALVDLAGGLWPESPPSSAGSFAARFDHPAMEAAVTHLNRARYGKAEGDTWKGDALWRAYCSGKRARGGRSETRRAAILPALYPQSTSLEGAGARGAGA